MEDGLLRITELLKVLALAAENRPTVDATLVQRILDEVGETLDASAEMPAYIRHTRELFEEAEALPPGGTGPMRWLSRSVSDRGCQLGIWSGTGLF